MVELIEGQEGLPVADPQSTEVPEAEQVPVWAQELRKQNEAAIEAMKVAQGQARRAEQRADALQDAVTRLIANQQAVTPGQPAQDAVEDLLKDLDDSDPATRAIKQALRETRRELIATRKELAQVTGHQYRQQMSQAEMDARNHNAQALMDYADLAGVDIETVMGEIQKLPTGQMWDEGRKLIRSKKGTGNGSAAKQEHIEALRESGKFGETRRGAGGAAVTDDNQFLADYTAGKVNDHARAMRLTGIKR